MAAHARTGVAITVLKLQTRRPVNAFALFPGTGRLKGAMSDWTFRRKLPRLLRWPTSEERSWSRHVEATTVLHGCGEMSWPVAPGTGAFPVQPASAPLNPCGALFSDQPPGLANRDRRLKDETPTRSPSDLLGWRCSRSAPQDRNADAGLLSGQCALVLQRPLGVPTSLSRKLR
jgi:hypothetical protein